ncbi:transmembrane protein [Roseibium sp. TrichSKD4]|uniref:DUF2306 domain-containing protein n=1 Tax=Roseibium sp. TrichSKD4 TaxID=744980 RepID=UPI0001E56B82|nr:DUF2306 domain-containing protein [Roseibium sp. TrichSKD4]EFO30728.1 transmembrane protein [Roseibium sp. TrichSKD4]
MSLAPLMNASFPVPLHALAAIAAFVLGGIQLLLAKGTRAHRMLGWVWIGLMLITAISAAFIYGFRMIGPFSPIHLLIPLTLYTLWQSIRAIGQGNIKAHRSNMIGLYIYALVLAGIFTFWPGRTMYQVVFGT